jgi:glycerophosphoryl diester phosphodiesterase
MFCLLLMILSAAAADRLPPDFMVIAHRGVVTETLKENSLPALEETIRRGYTHIEVDVRCTKDGHAVVLHDANLKRTAGVDRSVESLSLAELRKLAPKALVPSFEEFCGVCAGRIDLMIDAKGCPAALRDAYLASMEKSLEKHGLLENALFIGRFDVGRHFMDRAKVSWRGRLELFREKVKENPELAHQCFIFNHGDDFTAESVRGFQACGVPVIVSINTHHYRTGDPVARGLADVKKMLAWGADGLQIDTVYEPALPGLPRSGR